MKIITLRKGLGILLGVGALLVGVTVYSAISEVIAVGNMSHSELVNGPATMTVRRLTIAPGEVLGWHYHPDIGALTVVKRGTLNVEDGCGGEQVYTAGQAFLEPAGRIHRGKNLTAAEVETVQTFVVPLGTPTSVATQQMCGRPVTVDECKGNGWMSFNHPRVFGSQGDCIQFVVTGN